MKRTILLADDDASIRTMVGRLLESENYDVLLAADGNETASAFLNCRPDLVLLDLNMPKRDGWETIHLLRSMAPLVPVIVITARPNQHEEAMRRRIDALMEKPLDLPLLLQAIQDLLAESDEARLARVRDSNFETTRLCRDTPLDAGRRS
jgi:DNA-binding response OmpR family regulator